MGAAALLLLGAVAVPSWLSIGNLERQIDAANAAIDKKYMVRQLVRDSFAALESSRDDIASLRSIAINEGEELKFIDAIEQVQDRTGVQADISLVTVNQKTISPWEREIPITVSVRGDYRDVIRFLSGLEHLPYVISFGSINLRGEGDAAGRVVGGVRADLSGIVYWFGKNAPSFVNEAVPKTDKPPENL